MDKGRSEHVVRYEQTLPRARDDVFAFFAAAENLERITPPELRFRITSQMPIEMREGALIEYQLRLFGVPFTWRTRISIWNPPERFVDEQLNGPYRQWIHTHEFETVPGGTLVRDEVRYRLPLYPLGEVARPIVRTQVNRIFAYRRRRLEEIFGSIGHGSRRAHG